MNNDVPYPVWLQEQIAEFRRDRRRMQWRRYNYGEKGRARNARYDATPNGRARKLFYEQTIRAAMRAPGPYFRDGYRVMYASPFD
jgi:hypothetical protein